MLLAVMITAALCAGMLVMEGIPMMVDAIRNKMEWAQMRRAHYPRMYY